MFFGAGFFDASGRNADEDIALAVAGYAASRAQWEAFEIDWKKTLEGADISYFRMSEFINNGGQFAGWRERQEDKRKLLRDLTSIIKERVERAFGCVVLIRDFNAINSEYALVERFVYPFTLAAYETMKRMHLWAAAERHMPILAIFEDGDEDRGQLIRLARKELPEVLRPIFQPKSLPPLQAADIAAWDLRNTTVKSEQLAEYRLWRPSLERIGMTRENYGIYKRDDLALLCKKAGIPRRPIRRQRRKAK